MSTFTVKLPVSVYNEDETIAAPPETISLKVDGAKDPEHARELLETALQLLLNRGVLAKPSTSKCPRCEAEMNYPAACAGCGWPD